MTHAVSLVAQYFGSSGGELRVGGVPVGSIAAEYGTPLFVYDASVLERMPFTASSGTCSSPRRAACV